MTKFRPMTDTDLIKRAAEVLAEARGVECGEPWPCPTRSILDEGER